MQYSQMVLLNFNGLSWPHVSVASLVKQSVKSLLKDKMESKETVKESIDVKHFKAEIKELDVPLSHWPIPDPGPLRAGPAAAAPAEGRHFILPDERPLVADASQKEAIAEADLRRRSSRRRKTT